MPVLSVIVPMYNEEPVIEEAYRRLTAALSPMEDTYELIFVDDGSRDASAHIIERIMEGDARVRLIRFARNFGHQVAITAGADYARGQAVAVIDADLQDPPELLPEMLAVWREGYQVVYGQREQRKGDSGFKRFTAAAYYRILNWFSTVPIAMDTGDFRLMDRAAVDVLKSMREHNRFMRGLSSLVGFKQKAVLFKRDERWAGETKYPLRRMLRLAVDGILSFSSKPLGALFGLGGVMTGAGALWLLITLICAAAAYYRTDGFIISILLSFQLLLAGLLMAGMGVLGAYIARVYDEAKGRPLYWVSGVFGFDKLGDDKAEHDEEARA